MENTAVVKRISYSDLKGDPAFQVLCAEYAAECAMNNLPTPTPHSETYYAIEASGMGCFLGAYLGDDLVGFAVLISYMNPHYSRRLVVAESIFVGAEFRKSCAGMRLISSAKVFAYDEEAEALMFSAPVGGQFCRLLQALGSRLVSYSFLMDLK